MDKQAAKQPQALLPHYYCVAHIELFGQDELLRAMSKEELTPEPSDSIIKQIRQTFGLVERFHNFINDYLSQTKHQYIDTSQWQPDKRDIFWKMMKNGVQYQHRANAVLFFIPLEKLYPIPTADIFALFQLLSDLTASFHEIGFALRGGIAYGWAEFMENGDLYGPVTYEAYHLANYIACFPRIVISHKLIRYLKDERRARPVDVDSPLDRAYVAVEVGFAQKVWDFIAFDCGDYIIDYLIGEIKNYPGDESRHYHFFQAVTKGHASSTEKIQLFEQQGKLTLALKFKRLRQYIESRQDLLTRLLPGTHFSNISDTTSSLHNQPSRQIEEHDASEPVDGQRDDLDISYYCIAFLDFLGQKDTLKDMADRQVADIPIDELNQMRNATTNAINKLRGTLSVFCSPDHLSSIFEQTGIPVSFQNKKQANVSIQYLADAVILYIPLSDAFSRTSKLLSVLTILNACAFVFPVALAEGYVLRGAVEVGWGGELEPNELYGPALYEAFVLEGKAKYPRIAIGEKLIGYLSQTRHMPGEDDESIVARKLAHLGLLHIAADPVDEMPILDYLGEFCRGMWSNEHKDLLISDLIPSAYKHTRRYLADFNSRYEQYRAQGEVFERKAVEMLKICKKYQYLKQYIDTLNESQSA